MFDDENSDELEKFADNMKLRFSRKTMNSTKARIRNAINRESAVSDKRNSEMAHFLINHIDNNSKTKDSEYERNVREQHAVIVAISRLTSSVLNSIEVGAPIVVERTSANIASAKTDFRKITIGVRAGLYRESDRDSIAKLMHLTKGLVYHEGGHIKFTTPFNDLIKMSEYDVPHGKRFMMLNAWNILEDQRMETAMCTLSPVLSKYFTNIVINVVINKLDIGSNWPWLVGRTYLPSDIRKLFREAAEKHSRSYLIPQINECVMKYRKSTDAKEMVQCVAEFAELIHQWGSGGRNADEHSTFSDYAIENVPKPEDIPQPDSQGDELQEYEGNDNLSKPKDESSNDKEHDQEDATSSTPGAPQDKEEDVPDLDELRRKEEELEEFRNRANKLIRDNLSKDTYSASDREVDDFISVVNEVKNSALMPDRTISPMNEREIAQSKEVASSMLSVLERLFVQVEPTWTMYMEDGVIDPTAYALREPGDVNFWSGLDGNGGRGHDIAVSLLLDSSGSMQDSMGNVSIAAMGVRKACEQLGIPCTITTFNDDAYMVASPLEDIGFIRVSAEGGTSVLNAMMALEDQKHGMTYHLVMVLTDGEWYDVKDVRLWSQPQRHIVIAGFGSGMGNYISDKYADNYVVVDSPLELPGLVTDSLVKQFA